MLLLLPGTRLMEAQQQQSKTYVHSDGSRDVFDTTTGWTETDKNGKLLSHMSVADLTTMCSKSLETAVLLHLPPNDIGFVSMRVSCDAWAQLQPRSQIEGVSFSALMTRLVAISPPHTSFARYCGLELKSEAQAALYDSTIVPDDVGGHASCTVLQAHDPSGGMLYKYACSIKTASYSDAVALETTLVQRLNGLELTEDQVSEHGFTLKDKDDNECAPTGECTHSHMFISSIKDGKVVEIEAEPDFIRDGLLDLQVLAATGHHNFVEGIAPNSGTVEFAVYSHGSEQSQ